MTRINRKQRAFERREQDILDTALALCSTFEFESVTVDQIAERAEVSKGTLYKHFASKDELFFRLNMRFYHGLLNQLREKVTAQPPLQLLRHIIEHALRYHLQHAEYRYVVKYCDRLDFIERAEPAWGDDFLALDRAFQEWGIPIIQAAIDAGALQQRPVEALMIGLHACFKGTVTMLWTKNDWCPLANNASDEELLKAMTDFMMAGLIGQPATL